MTDPAGETDPQLDERLQRLARRSAAPQSGPEPTTGRRSRPAMAGAAGRWVATGAAVGAGLTLTGAMVAAARQDGSGTAEAEPAVIRRVVVPDPVVAESPQRIVIVLPGADLAAVSASGAETVSVPALPAPAPRAAAPQPAPVTESSGS